MTTVLEFQPELVSWLDTKPTLKQSLEIDYYDRNYLRLNHNSKKILNINKSDWNLHIYVNSRKISGHDYCSAFKRYLPHDVDEYFDSKKISVDHFSGATDVYNPTTPWMIHHRAWHFLSIKYYDNFLPRIFDYNPGGVDYLLLGVFLNSRCLRPGMYFPTISDLDAEYFASFFIQGIKFKTSEQCLEYIDYLDKNEPVEVRYINSGLKPEFIGKCINSGKFFAKFIDEKPEILDSLKSRIKEISEHNIVVMKNYIKFKLELLLRIIQVLQYLDVCDIQHLNSYISNIIRCALSKWYQRDSFWAFDHVEYTHFGHMHRENYMMGKLSRCILPARFHRELSEIFQMINTIKTFVLK